MSRAQDLAVVTAARARGGVVAERDLIRLTGRPDEVRRRLRSGLWQRVLPGVLAPAAVSLTEELVATAALLWAPEALLSHHFAARREGIWVPEGDHLRVVVPFTSRRRSVVGLEVVRTRHFPRRCRAGGGLRWTQPTRTIVDLAACLSRKQLEATLLSAVRVRGVDPREVLRIADAMPGRAGLADLRAVVGLWTPERESLLEDRLHAAVRAATDLEVVRQHQVCDRNGRLVARVDVAVPELRLAFEADGLRYHSSDEQLAGDQARDRQLLALGWLVVRFREDALRDRARVAAEIARLVRSRRVFPHT